MRREFVPFDAEVIESEFEALPAKDRAKLHALIEHYEACGLGNPAPAQVDDYGDGLLRLRHIKPAYQGRAIFCAAIRSQGYEKFVILAV